MRIDLIEDKYKLSTERWTVSSKKKNNAAKKYSLTIVLFIIGLIFVGKIKEETRILQKEINNLKVSINELRVDLHQATLNQEVIASPENITHLAKKYLEIDLDHYKKNQIKNLNQKEKFFVDASNEKSKSEFSNKSILNFVKKNESKNNEEIYYTSKKLPTIIKHKLSKKIKETKDEVTKLYNNPSEIITSKKARKWVGIQVVKAFFGFPVIPGK